MGFLNNRRIAKNSLLLYIRMFFLLGISLYTYRVVLSTLGIEDYGIYNVIGGIITLFSFISNSLVSVIQRYFNVALGKGDDNYYNRIYSMSINIFFIFSVILLLLGESLGLWFVNTKLNIPTSREYAALFVYHISLVTIIIKLFRSQDNASIISYEKMSFYAYISVLEVLLNLGLVFMIKFLSWDKLVLFAFLQMVLNLIINIIYKSYCKRNFYTCRYRLIWDNKLFKELLSFSGWSIIKQAANVITAQGQNILLNINFSVSINAARGTSAQIYNGVNLFLTNFQTAFNPQLIKTYASGEYEDHYNLLYRSSKFSCFLMMLLVIPVSLNLAPIITLWLQEIPPYTCEFCVFILYAYLMDSIGAPFTMSIFANGNIKLMQIACSFVFIIELLVSIIVLNNNVPPYIVSFFTMLSHFFIMVISIYISHIYCKVNMKIVLKNIFSPIILVSLIYFPFVFICNRYIKLDGILVILSCLLETIILLLVIWSVGLSRKEKEVLTHFAINRISRINNKFHNFNS